MTFRKENFQIGWDRYSKEFINYRSKDNATCAVLKPDFAKASDSIDWFYLKDLLLARGFGARWGQNRKLKWSMVS